jgi:hypothetical protein
VQDSDASTWVFAKEAVPAMKAQAYRNIRDDVVTEAGEEGPIAPMDASCLAGHLGLTHAEILFSVASAPEETSKPPLTITDMMFV